MAIPKFKPLQNLSGSAKEKLKPFFGIIIALLLGAFGLEATKTDFDMGSLLKGESLKDSKIVRDEKGNLVFKRDATGGFLLENCQENLYNCANFKTQKEAMEVFQKCGGKGDDVNGLDGDKDGRPCEDLPTGK